MNDLLNLDQENYNNQNFSKETEKRILSAIMNNHSDTDDILYFLNIDDFFIDDHKIIYAVITKLKNNNKTLDHLSIINFIDNNSAYVFNDYQSVISKIYFSYDYPISILTSVEIIKNLSLIRRLRYFGKYLLDLKINVNNVNEVIFDLENKFLNAIELKNTKRIEHIEKAFIPYREKINQLRGRQNTLTGTTSGYFGIDKITNGFQQSDLIIIAARPGIGKTALALNFLLNAANECYRNNANLAENKKPEVVVFFSMEMATLQICERLGGIASNIDLSISKKGQWDDQQFIRLNEAINRTCLLPIYIDDSSDITILDVQQKIKQLSQTNTVKLIIIDYLQLLRVPEASSMRYNRQQEVTVISKMLKSLARLFDVPVIALSQLSRKIEERKGESKRPILSDLRESGSIEQDADIVSFLNYKDENLQETAKNSVMVEYIIAKHRNGALGVVDLIFNKQIGKYIESRKDYYEKN